MEAFQARILEIAEGADLEVKAALGRDGKGELPKSFWETYSAMANTDGGIVLLGIAEEASERFRVMGIANIEKVMKALWDGANNRQQISANLLSESAVSVLDLNGENILRVAIPRAKRGQRPVFVGGNPLEGTYQRNYEGDYRCDPETVRRMLAEQVEDERDGRWLADYSMDDLHPQTLRDYRAATRQAKPNLAWHELGDEEFLRALGVIRRDRETKKDGLTLGGLLMLGRLTAIQEAVPNYMLDYQERPAPRVEARWIDRLTTDGEWSGNLFDFCRLTLKRLYRDLPIPFQLQGGTRVDETPVHVALREALVNTLIHADFSGRVSILVVKRPDLFGFRNPGGMRISIEDALAGGISDCRNRLLQRLFRMAGYAEQAGYGIPAIFSGWAKQLWRSPHFVERRDNSEHTVLTLPVLSLLTDETVETLEGRFGARFHKLTMIQKMALATVAVEGKVSHARLKRMAADHPRDITASLAWLCREGFLESAGVTRATSYFFPGEPPAHPREQLSFDSLPARGLQNADDEPTAASSAQTAARSAQTAASSEQTATSSEQTATRSEQTAARSEQWKRMEGAARPVRERRKLPRDTVVAVLLEVCSHGYLTLQELHELTARSAGTLRVHYLSALVKEGKLRLKFPATPNHPEQAYTSMSPAET